MFQTNRKCKLFCLYLSLKVVYLLAIVTVVLFISCTLSKDFASFGWNELQHFLSDRATEGSWASVFEAFCNFQIANVAGQLQQFLLSVEII